MPGACPFVVQLAPADPPGERKPNRLLYLEWPWSGEKLWPMSLGCKVDASQRCSLRPPRVLLYNHSFHLSHYYDCSTLCKGNPEMSTLSPLLATISLVLIHYVCCGASSFFSLHRRDLREQRELWIHREGWGREGGLGRRVREKQV